MQTPTRLLVGASLVAALAAGILGLVAASAQDKPAAPPVPAAPAAPAAPGRDAPDFAALVKALGDEETGTRAKAYEALESGGAAARKALDEGAKSHDVRVRRSARRLLWRLDNGEPGPRGVLRFEEGADRSPGPRFPDMPDIERQFADLPDIERQFRDMERRLEDLRGTLRFDPMPGTGGARVERRVVVDRDGERIEAGIDAEGKVTVKVGTKGADGSPTEETFEAKDMAALEKDHPDIAAKVKGLLGNGIEIRGLPGFEAPARPALGVTVSGVPPVLRTQLSIPENEGVVVEEVLPGTIAERLGLRHHDVVLSVNGIPVSSAGNLRFVVGFVKEGGNLRFEVLRRGKAEEISGPR